MEIETILNAMVLAHAHLHCNHSICSNRGERQFLAFRARILKVDAEKDARIVELLKLQTKEALLRYYGDDEYWFNKPQPKKELHGGRK